MSEFRFSPRANRAHEIGWRPWDNAAFKEAKDQGKPVLLAISGVWCHWCHVMDETSYSDPGIIATVNSRFIPVRVDTDMRPDVNERYNLGGWPTTALLDGEGNLIAGGTYVPPKTMLPWLRKVASSYKGPGQRVSTGDGDLAVDDVPGPPQVSQVYDRVISVTRASYDREHHGFGREPKFPMVFALELCLDDWLAHGSKESREILVSTLRAMASGGMYDHVEGGFFRYSTTRDWSIPHFEKMLEDNSALLGLLARTCRALGGADMEKWARDVLRYLEANFYTPGTGWAGTQDADEEYYSRGLQERTSMNAPYIDRIIYVNWNAQMAKALLEASWALDDQHMGSLALDTLDVLLKDAYLATGGMAHYLDGSPELWGRLQDAAWMGWALCKAYQATGRKAYLDASKNLATFVLERLRAPGGGFYDTAPDPEAPGALAIPHWSLDDNAIAGRWLKEIGQVTEETHYSEAAFSVVGPGIKLYERLGPHAAAFALLCADLVRPWTVIDLTPGASRELLNAALSAPGEQRVTRPDRPGLGTGGEAMAYVCLGQRCLEPTADPQTLSRQLLSE
jgi:uncharacterized protein YyaL (SSP411 family)